MRYRCLIINDVWTWNYFNLYAYIYIYTYIHTYIHTTPHHTTPHTIPYHTIPYHTIPYHTNIHTYIHAYIHIHTYIHTDIILYIQTDRRTDARTDGQTDRHTCIRTYIQTYPPVIPLFLSMLPSNHRIATIRIVWEYLTPLLTLLELTLLELTLLFTLFGFDQSSMFPWDFCWFNPWSSFIDCVTCRNPADHRLTLPPPSPAALKRLKVPSGELTKPCLLSVWLWMFGWNLHVQWMFDYVSRFGGI